MRRAALLTFCVLALAGCGGGGDEESEAPPASAPAASAEPQMAAEVAIEDFTFKPGDVTVSTGDEVTWSNADTANHNVVFEDKAQKGIPNIREGQDGSVSFSEAGKFSYVCSYHPGMEGTVVVE